MNLVKATNCKKRLLTMILVSQFLSATGLPVLALSAVRVAGQQAIVITSGAAGVSAAQRAATIQKNIDNALYATSDHSPSAVGITYVNKQPVLTLGGFYIATIDNATAKQAHSTPALLAQQWASGLRRALSNKVAVNNYIAKLSNIPAIVENVGTTTTDAGSYPYVRQGKVVYIPAGMTIPITMSTSLSSEMARSGDPIEARISQTVNLGDTTIPEGSVVLGQVTESVPGARMSHSGHLGFKFNRLRTPDGAETPISAHIISGVKKYGQIDANSDLYQGETTKGKAGRAAIHGAVGAGAGALLGTTIGAIAGRGHGAGRGAIAGATLGGALGVAESLLLRKNSDVKVRSGENLTLQLDAPASIAISSSNM